MRQSGLTQQLTMWHLYNKIYGVLKDKAVTHITWLHALKLEMEK
jgi:isochorismate synthase EntC